MSSINNNTVNVMSEFNASISVTELLTKTLENMAKELAIRCITKCASMYKFDAVDAIVALGLQNLSLTRKPMHKKSVEEPIVKELIVKPIKAAKEPKSTFPFPFEPSRVNEQGCKGLSYNHGLFTQCSKSCMSNGSFCKSCQTEADNSSTGRPDCGTVAQRIDTELYEFKDSKGRSPISYTKFLEKAKLTAEQAVEEAGKLNFVINECHFVKKQVNKEDATARGRPKKIVALVKAETVDDLFANLANDAAEEEESESEAEVEVEEKKAEPKVVIKVKSIVMSDEDKALKKAAFEAEREARRETKRTEKALIAEQEKEAKKAALEVDAEAKKVAAEAKKAALEVDAEAKKAAAEDKKVAAEAEKEAKKVAAEDKKVAAEAEKEAKKVAAEAEKEAKKVAAEDKKVAAEQEKEAKKVALEAKKAALEAKKVALEAEKEAKKPKPVPAVIQEPIADKPKSINVTQIEFNGITYLKSGVNMVYTQDREEFGIWNETTQTIDPLPPSDSDSEEEEDEYEDEYEDEDEEEA
jgi:hypothetical protein